MAHPHADDIQALTGRLEIILQHVAEADWRLVRLVVEGQLNGLETVLELVRREHKSRAAQWLSQPANVHRLLYAIAEVESGQGIGYASVDELWQEFTAGP